MENKSNDSLLLTDFPYDILLQIFRYFRLFDILNLSATCKRLRLAVDEHQVWLQQVKLLQIPIPPGAIPSKTELKDWAISRAKVDIRWVKSGDDGDDLVVYRFDFNSDPVMHAYYLPGGEFVVFLYTSGRISLKRIQKSIHTGEWQLCDVVRFNRKNAEGRLKFSNRTLNEISYGRFTLVYTVEGSLNRLFIFFIDTVSQTIDEGPVVRINPPPNRSEYYKILAFNSVWAVKNTIFYCRELHDDEHESKFQLLVVVRLGAEVIQREFIMPTGSRESFVEEYCHFFAMSENSVVLCDPSGVYGYEIPELESERNDAFLSYDYVSSDPGCWFRGSLCDSDSPNPTLYFHGPEFMGRVEFELDKPGRFVVVANYATEKNKYYGDDRRGGSDDRVTLKGRKVLSYEDQPKYSSFITLKTALLGGGNASRKLRTRIATIYRRKLVHVRQVELDERTGRILIAADYPTTEEVRPFARRIYLADLPK